MRKNISIAVVALAAIALLSASCEKQNQAVFENDSTVFTAVIDHEIAKTTLNDLRQVEWASGDLISINGKTFSAVIKNDDHSKADFEPLSDVSLSAPYNAIFPAALENNGAYEFPAIQPYKAGQFNAPLFAASEDKQLVFRNICGVVCLALKGTDKVRSIAITANEALCGKFTMAEDGKTVNPDCTGKTVTLDCGAEGAQLNEDAATKFYIYLPPQTYSAGMKFTVTNVEGGIFENTTVGNAKIERNYIYTFDWTAEFAAAEVEGALDGEFSVSASKKVHFSKGNLYWDGDSFEFESKQYNYEVSTTHASYFYWSKDAAVARKSSRYSDASASDSDVLFTNATATTPKADFTVAGVTGKFRALSADEWVYLFTGRNNASKLYKTGVLFYENTNATVGREIIVIAPDNYTGTIAARYTASEWEVAEEAGLVCLPLAGHDGIQCNSSAFYWTSVPDGKSNAYCVWYNNPKYNVESDSREYRYCIRLVTE